MVPTRLVAQDKWLLAYLSIIIPTYSNSKMPATLPTSSCRQGEIAALVIGLTMSDCLRNNKVKHIMEYSQSRYVANCMPSLFIHQARTIHPVESIHVGNNVAA